MSWWVEILGKGWPVVIGLMRNESVPWEVIPEVFKCSVLFQGAREYLKSGVCENNPQTRKDIIRKEIRRIPQAILNRVVDNFNVRFAVVLSYTSVVHGVNIVLLLKKYSKTLLITLREEIMAGRKFGGFDKNPPS